MRRIIEHLMAFFDWLVPLKKQPDKSIIYFPTVEEAWQRDFEAIGNDMRNAISRIRDIHADLSGVTKK